MEDEPQPASATPILGRTKVDTDEPPALDLDPALFAGLAPTRLPGRFTVGLQLAARDGPMPLVGRVEHEQTTALIEEQRPRGGGYPRRLTAPDRAFVVRHAASMLSRDPVAIRRLASRSVGLRNEGLLVQRWTDVGE